MTADSSTHIETTRAAKPRLRDTWPIHGREAGLFFAAFVGLTAVFGAIGLLLTHPLKDSFIVHNDERLASWWAEDRTAWVARASRWGAELAGTMTKIGVTIVIAAIMLAVWKRWFESMVVISALILEAATFVTVTEIVRRDRPAVPRLENSPIASSFPSGHAAAAAAYGAIAVIVFWHARRPAAKVAAVVVTATICVIVSVCRMYMGMHFLTDVIAGLTLGVLCVVIAVRILATSPQGEAALAEIARDERIDQEHPGTLASAR